MNIFRTLFKFYRVRSVICFLFKLSTMLKMFPGVSERLFLVATFSSMLKNVSTVFGFIL